MGENTQQLDLFKVDSDRKLLDELLEDSLLYKNSKDYMALLDFISKMKSFAPFNAMLLQIQKPGLSYAASKKDWAKRFSREIKEDSRPLLILMPFAPVSFVYDVMDTHGAELPEDVVIFPVTGEISKDEIRSFVKRLRKKGIDLLWFDGGDKKAGSIERIKLASDSKKYSDYNLKVNEKHKTEIQFVTLAHELGHLFLGHLGEDLKLKIPIRRKLEHSQREIEAESVAYLVCQRHGVKPKSQTYLSNFVGEVVEVKDIDFYSIMKAAGQVEAILGIKYRA